MRAIVTGSEGFIGKVLCRRLQPLFEVIRIDTKIGCDAARIEPLLAHGDIDAVFHLAAETSVFNDRLDDIERENVHAFMVVATACRRYGVKLVYASSSTANACNTTSMYGMTKHFNEQFAKAYCPRATGVRLHNVYGPSPREGTLLFNLLMQCNVLLLKSFCISLQLLKALLVFAISLENVFHPYFIRYLILGLSLYISHIIHNF